ncbi:MAG: efflux RND transporter periplasmic adaptor subunit [Burkholderiales bacterium]
MTKGTTKRMIVMLLLVGLVFAGIFGFQQFRNQMIKKMISGKGAQAQAVSTIVAEPTEWQPTVDAVGDFRASKGANLSTEVGGLVTAIHFESGKNVQKGQLLVDLNSAPLRAQLAQLQASAHLAKVNYDRDVAQLKIQAISQAVVDTDAANLKIAQAQAAAQAATIDQKAIRAPFSGRLGIRQIDLGQYIAPGATIVSLQKLDPLYVDFTLPQTEIGLIHLGDKVAIQTNALADKNFTGVVSAIEPQIDTATRNLKVRASIRNPEGVLLPGLFATIRVNQGSTKQYISLPATAIAYNPYGSTVFIVKNSGKNVGGKPALTVEQRFVTTGPTRGDQIAIIKGVKAGEVIVTGGQMKLHNGAAVFVNNSVVPANNPHPEVNDE